MRATLSVLVAALTAGAWPVSALDPPAELVSTLATRVKSLTRPVYTYHYAIRHRLSLPDGYVAPDDATQRPYLLMKVGRYWDLGIPVAPYGTASGLYVGSDPVTPRAFGGVGNVWSMAEIVLPAGFRFIDVRRREDAPAEPQKLPARVRERLAELGCQVEYPETLVVAMESKPCREIAVRALRELHVEGILYTFARSRFKACPDRPEGGFIVLAPGVVATDTKLFTSDWADDSAQADRLRVREIFRLARDAGSRRELPWPEVPGAARSDEVIAWMRRHLFGCGDYAEDALPPPLQ